MHNNINRIPKFAQWLLKKTIKEADRDTILGDFQEFHKEKISEKGIIPAWFWYWKQVFVSIPEFMNNSIYWSAAMLKNYLKIAFRTARKRKVHSIINIMGLALGVACFISLFVYINNELSYDTYHANADRIYRMNIHAVTSGTEFTWPSSNAVAAGTLLKDYPEVENAVRFGIWRNLSVKYKNRKFVENNAVYADASLFDIFTCNMIKGDPSSALKNPFSVVITEEMAEKYFGNEDPVGKILLMSDRDRYTVTGVIENVPLNSHFRFDIAGSFETLYAGANSSSPVLTDWMSYNFMTYILLKEGIDYKNLENKFPAMLEQYAGKNMREMGAEMEYFLQPLLDIRLHTPTDGTGVIVYVYLFSAIAVLILLIACINFMNLTTARSADRAPEIGLRKVFGAERKKLINQFIGEAVFFSFFSVLISLLLVELFLPLISSVSGTELSINYLESPPILPGLAGLALIVGLLAGCYPAFVLSSFQPVKTIKGKSNLKSNKSTFRNVCVVTQFTVSIALTIGTGLIINQMDFMRSKDPGFNKEQVVVVRINNENVRSSVDVLKEKLKSGGYVLNAAAASNIPGGGAQLNRKLPEGYKEDQVQLMQDIIVDEDFLSVMGMNIVSGRDFSKEFPADRKSSIIINQTAVETFGWEDPLGKIIRSPVNLNPVTWEDKKVVGVVKDFFQSDFTNNIRPVHISASSNSENNTTNFLCIKIKPGETEKSLTFINKTWGDLFPNLGFDSFFLDQSFDQQFRQMEQVGDVFSWFSFTAILIACLGLFSLASFMAEIRKKEIGIRKVLGARTGGIVLMLNKDVLKLLACAGIIACPMVYFLFNRFIRELPYRADISIYTFILSSVLILAVAAITVAYHSLKAALANPVDSIKYE